MSILQRLCRRSPLLNIELTPRVHIRTKGGHPMDIYPVATVPSDGYTDIQAYIDIPEEQYPVVDLKHGLGILRTKKI